jgi:hypothetical protein
MCTAVTVQRGSRASAAQSAGIWRQDNEASTALPRLQHDVCAQLMHDHVLNIVHLPVIKLQHQRCGVCA